MKQLYTFLMIGTMVCTMDVCAATIQGKVLDKTDNALIIQTQDGNKMKMHVSDQTTYRQKKEVHDNKQHQSSKHQSMMMYTPMVEEDDWIEVQYTPSNDELSNAVIENVVVYDD